MADGTILDAPDPETEKKSDNQDILREIKDRFRVAHDAVNQDYQDALDDLNFCNGEQWPSALKAQREADDRPCLVIDKISNFADQVKGDIRQNEPSGKVKPVDSKSDPETAEIITGLIRNIEYQSDAETIYDTAAESMVDCGYGAWRINTRYADDDQFEQDIIVEPIKNPFTVYWDPACKKWDKSDARFCFVTEKIPKDEFERLYPDASLMPFEGSKDMDLYWGDDQNIRVVEYFKKESIKKTLYLVQRMVADIMGNPVPGEIYVTEMEPDPAKLGEGWKVLKTREVESYKIVWYKANQAEIIEGPSDRPGQHIPVVMITGKELNIEGHTYSRGVIRKSKDAQRLYNYSRSTSAEVVSLAPKAPYLVTSKMISNYQKIWDQAHKKSFPYLPYDPDPGAPQGPQRMEPISVNTGIQNEIMIADQELHDTTGLNLASLGRKSNETSGRAILARQREGDVGNYTYYDNLARGIRYSWKIIIGLIPHIYDTPRILRILNKDGSDKFVPVNQPTQDNMGIAKIHDLTVGKYDVVVTIGPSFSTEREEAATNMLELVKVLPPQAGALISDVLVGNFDWPKADLIAKRLKMLLPPQIQQQESDGKPLPPAPPDPMQQLTIQKLMMELKKIEGEAKGADLDAEIKFVQLQRLKAGLPMEPRDFPPQDVEKGNGNAKNGKKKSSTRASAAADNG